MKNEELVSMLLTFAMGCAAGVFLYVTEVKPIEVKLTTPTANVDFSYVINGFAYGQCAPSCPQFQVREGGEYRYMHVREGELERQAEGGQLSGKLSRSLNKYVIERELVRQSRPAPEDECVKNENGVSIRYEVDFEGTLYLLNSCGTRIDYTSNLWQTLNEVWVYLSTQDESNS